MHYREFVEVEGRKHLHHARFNNNDVYKLIKEKIQDWFRDRVNFINFYHF